MSKQDWQKNNVATMFNLPHVESVLDVACGLSLKSKYIDANIRVGVDIYPTYFEHIETDVPYVVIRHDVRNLNEIFLPKSFDIVIALDIIEHLEKEESLEMLRQCEQIARKAVIIETPKGYVPQNMDILGHGGDEFQTHRCGWEITELETMGYVCSVRDYVMQDVKRHTELEVNPSIQMIDAIKWLKS